MMILPPVPGPLPMFICSCTIFFFQFCDPSFNQEPMCDLGVGTMIFEDDGFSSAPSSQLETMSTSHTECIISSYFSVGR